MTISDACSCAACAAAAKLSSSSADGTPQAAAVPVPPAQPVVAYPYTGDYRVDTLLEGLQYRWNSALPLGTRSTVTYSFMTAKPVYGGTDTGGDTGFSAFTAEQMAVTRTVFARLGKEIGLSFVEVGDSFTSYGQIRLGNNTQSQSAGYAWLPNSTGDAKSGDVWIDNTFPSDLVNMTPGTYQYATLVHEIGHALGLKHSGDYTITGTTGQPGNYLGVAEDNTNYTIMSYHDPASGLQREWFGMYDLLALRTLYGAGTGSSGNDTYRVPDSAGTSLNTLYDSGGIDTLDVSAVSVSATIDLRAGAFSSIGRSSSGPASKNISIDLATTIENFVGTIQADTVIGNSANNRLTLGAGVNTADGGAGLDTAAYAGAKSSYEVSNAGGTIRVAGGTTSDTLTNIERLAFADLKVGFDMNAGITAKVLGAIYGKAAVSNAEYAGVGISLLDAGMSYVDLVQLALNGRLGGPASNEAMVSLVYTNLTGAAPVASELAFYTGLITSGQFSQVSLALFAADTPLNQGNINLVGLAGSGLNYL